MIRLPANADVRECAALKQQLLMHLESVDAVLIDVSDVQVIDTAALQLLFAFGRERLAGGLETLWQGDSQVFRSAATAAGLQMGTSTCSKTTSASQHDA
jgi:phospholipid transport system transporter-binding protein